MKNIKKLFKKISGIALCLIPVLYNIPVAFAAGSVALSITGPGTASVGDKITLTFRTSSVSSDDGKIYSLGGTLNFDDTILKVNSCTSKAAGLNGGSVNGKIIGLYDASYATGVGNNADLMSCEFEALATGSTTVTISALEINDINTDVLSSSITGKLVTVGGATPTSSSTSKPTSSSTSSTSTSTSSSSAPAPSTNAKPTSISVSGYNNVEEDNLAFEAFRKVYEPYQAMTYLNLATQLVEANLIPTIISEKPLRLTILNGLVTLNEYGEEIKVEPKAEPKAEVDGPTFIVDDIEYCMVENPNTTDGRYHPMIARVDGEEVPNRKEVARKFLRNYGYEEDYFNRTNTGNLENQIYRILGEE